MKLKDVKSERFGIDLLEEGCRCDGCGNEFSFWDDDSFWEVAFEGMIWFFCWDCECKRRLGLLGK